jgi:hypothetical protein
MASEVRVNQIQNQSGLGTVTFYNSGQQFSGITTVPSLYVTTVNDGPISGARNRIINGDMRLDQRNAGASVTVAGLLGDYTLDRWMGYEFTDGVATIIRSSTAPVGFSNSLLWTTTTADASLAAGQFAMVQQKIEGFNTSDLAWGTSSAKSVTLSFYVRSSLTGTFDGAIVNGASPADRSYVFNYTISSANTWEYKTVTIPGDTTGTWNTDNTTGMVVRFSMGTGTTYQTTANAWAAGNFLGTSSGTSVVGTLNATWYVTGVQLEVGSTATPFERRSYGQELALCQRYCHKWGANGDGNNLYSRFPMGIWGSTTQITVPFSHPVSMRTVTKTVSSNTSAINVYSQGLTFNSGATFAVNTDANTLDTTFVNVSGLSGGTGNALAAARFLADGNAYILFTTEL